MEGSYTVVQPPFAVNRSSRPDGRRNVVRRFLRVADARIALFLIGRTCTSDGFGQSQNLGQGGAVRLWPCALGPWPQVG